MSRNAFSKIEREMNETQALREHAAMERAMSIGDDLLEQQEKDGSPECPHDEGTRFQAYDSDGCGFYIWKCDACGWECVDDLS